MRLYSFLLKQYHDKEGECKIRKHEKLYRKNFYKFAKEACNGTLDSESVKPKFKEDEAFRFYSERYSNAGELDTSKLEWFEKVEEPKHKYNQSAIKPGQVKAVLKNKSPNTAPGEDGLHSPLPLAS